MTCKLFLGRGWHGEMKRRLTDQVGWAEWVPTVTARLGVCLDAAALCFHTRFAVAASHRDPFRPIRPSHRRLSMISRTRFTTIFRFHWFLVRKIGEHSLTCGASENCANQGLTCQSLTDQVFACSLYKKKRSLFLHHVRLRERQRVLEEDLEKISSWCVRWHTIEMFFLVLTREQRRDRCHTIMDWVLVSLINERESCLGLTFGFDFLLGKVGSHFKRITFSVDFFRSGKSSRGSFSRSPFQLYY